MESGHLNLYLVLEDKNLYKTIFKSSNACLGIALGHVEIFN